MVVGLVQQVAHLQPGLRLGGVKLGAQLLRRVVPHQLVVAAAAELFALDAAERCGVGLALCAWAGRCAGRPVPGGAVAACARADQVALRRWRVVGGLRQGIERGFSSHAARRGRDTRLTPAVVERRQDHGAVDVVAQEGDQHLLTDARDELVAHAGA